MNTASEKLITACRDGRLDEVMQLAGRGRLLYGAVTAKDNLALRSACYNGHIAVVMWLMTTYGIGRGDCPARDRNAYMIALDAACAGGKLEVVEWLVSYFAISPEANRRDNNKALISACAGGHLDIAKWLAAHFDLSASDACSAKEFGALSRAAAMGHADIVRWLIEDLRVVDVQELRCALDDAFDRGHLAIAELIAGNINVTESDVDRMLTRDFIVGNARSVKWLIEHFSAANAGSAMLLACEYGHLELAKWLASRCICDVCELMGTAIGKGHWDIVEWVIEYYKVCKLDAYEYAMYALQLECMKDGNLQIIEQLVMRFGITEEDLREEQCWPFELACMHGRLEIAAWLDEYIGLTQADARDGNCLAHACRNGQLEMAQWLTQRFSLDATDARARDNYALRWASANGHLSVVVWLVENFKLSADDIRTYDNYAQDRARDRGHAELADWLQKRSSP